jgi:hypothetical protein
MAICNQCGRRDLGYWRPYNTTAKTRLVNPDGSDHLCTPILPDTIQCLCGDMVQRYEDGHKLNMDHTPHVCAKPVTVTIAPHAAAPIPRSAPKPVNPSGYWRGVVSTEIHRGV